MTTLRQKNNVKVVWMLIANVSLTIDNWGLIANTQRDDELNEKFFISFLNLACILFSNIFAVFWAWMQTVCWASMNFHKKTSKKVFDNIIFQIREKFLFRFSSWASTTFQNVFSLSCSIVSNQYILKLACRLRVRPWFRNSSVRKTRCRRGSSADTFHVHGISSTVHPSRRYWKHRC